MGSGCRPHVWWGGDSCTISTHYQSQSGIKLGDTVAFELKNKPFWEEHRFRVSDAYFGSSEGVDLRIQVEVTSPLLGVVVIAAPMNPNER